MKEKEYYFYYRTKAEIHAGLNKFKLAIEAANKSIKLAEKRGTKNLISLNKKSIESGVGGSLFILLFGYFLKYIS